LAKGLETTQVESLDGVDLDQCRIDDGAFSKERGEQVRFDGVHVVGGTLSETRFTRLSWVDVLCERSDLSRIEWPEAKWTRVELRDCGATGASLTGGELESVRFVQCKLDYASFSGARFRHVSFERCRLIEVDFRAADLAGTTFVECDLQGVDLTGANLQGADVSTSTLNAVHVEARDVRGLVVNREQAAVLSQLFGLVLRDG
jgi:uncharacterized protein YjbI with pentapeptide repeats